MLEVHGDFWSYGPADARVITTNQHRTKPGLAVMGRGVALQAKARYPGLDLLLGRLLAGTDPPGYHVAMLHEGRWAGFPAGDPTLLSFPVKAHLPERCSPRTPCWKDKASLDLIIRSARELYEMTERMGWNRVLLPRPGCGAGGLDWDVVQWPLQLMLPDERFHVIDW